MKRWFFIFLAVLYLTGAKSQFAPPAGQTGTTAIYKDSSVFVAWAGSCVVSRGWQDIADTVLGKTTYGVDSNGVGMADNAVVSLGDGGMAVVSFRHPVVDGPGYDFAVFENGLNDSFLELAFVEVSSDSIHFVRFPAISLTDTTIQVGSFGSVDATKIHNLAGKYRALYGTPFDLSNLQDSGLVDINNVRFVRIVDVIGTISDSLCSWDSQGHKVNDPYPTAFNTGGFDLDAVGIIHADFQNISLMEQENDVVIFPNPVSGNGDLVICFMNGKIRTVRIQIFNTLGRLIFTGDMLVNDYKVVINLGNRQPGVYYLNVETNEYCFKKKIVVF